MRRSLLVGLFGLLSFQSVSAARVPASSKQYCSVFYSEKSPANCQPPPSSFLNFSRNSITAEGSDNQALEDAFKALAVLQNDYFDAQEHTWSTAIDWTAAVIETIVSGMLTTLTTSLDDISSDSVESWKAKENLISFFYDQVAIAYFGQDAVAITGQAYDDILWVVLGWIEATRFVQTYSALHYAKRAHQCKTSPSGLQQALDTVSWHGYTSFCSFAHRARIFWDLGDEGWDTKLCHGGMIWNPRLIPYKNAITNELYIAASISMYQHFPGDDFKGHDVSSSRQATADPVYLESAIKGYKWLVNVGMTNDQGLYVDGFHVDMSKPGNVECDQRDEMVYTYNQGVVLTGQRGLWEVTGSPSYLDDGHRLIQSAIRATGWILDEDVSEDDLGRVQAGELPPWRGLGRGGILEDECDASATCSQDSQTFKGIFFHHFTAFCAPLDDASSLQNVKVNGNAYSRVESAHATACKSYLTWVKHNARAAMKTRDDKGHFGMWWGAGIFEDTYASAAGDGIDHSAPNVTDYRNHGTPEDKTWGLNGTWTPGISGGGLTDTAKANSYRGKVDRAAGDPNDRGLGRTVETQTGGLSLLRAYWELSRM